VADRRVVRDELLLNEVYGVQAGNKGLHGDEARHKPRKDLPSRPPSKRGHTRTYRQTGNGPTRRLCFQSTQTKSPHWHQRKLWNSAIHCSGPPFRIGLVSLRPQGALKMLHILVSCSYRSGRVALLGHVGTR
jgi:hypothetical protein